MAKIIVLGAGLGGMSAAYEIRASLLESELRQRHIKWVTNARENKTH